MTRAFGLRGASGVVGPEEAIYRLAQQLGNLALADQSGLTDNSNGSAIATRILVAAPTLANEADDGTSLATTATVVTSLDSVGNALSTILGIADTLGAILGTLQITDSSGFSDGSGTIADIGDGGSAAAVGPQATEFNASVALLIAMFEEAISVINPIAKATGQIEITWATDPLGILTAEVEAITNDGGTPADPGVTEAAADTLFGILEDNIATLAAVINAATTYSGPKIVAY